MRRVILASLSAVLASCGPAPVTENRATPTAPAIERETATAPADPTPVAATPVPAIPAALHGRWGLVPGDCTSTRGDAKGLIQVSSDHIKFYESRATLGVIAESSDSRLVADFGFSGEGQSWQRRMTLEAQDGGKALVRTETGPDAMPGPLRYTRCEE